MRLVLRRFSTDAELILKDRLVRNRGGEAAAAAAATGFVQSVSGTVAVLRNVPWARMNSLVRFRAAAAAEEGRREGCGVVVRIGKGTVHALVVQEPVSAGDTVPVEDDATRRVLSMPCGDAVRGRVLNVLGKPIDGVGALSASAETVPAQTPTISFAPPSVSPPGVKQRSLFHTQLVAGVPMLDALAPIACGQRLVVMGPGDGPSAFALEVALSAATTAARQKGDAGAQQQPVHVVYAPIRGGFRAHHALVQSFQRAGALESATIVVSSTPAEAAGGHTANLVHQALAPFAAMRIAEQIRDAGGHALCVIDGMDVHADAVGACLALAGVATNPRACQAALLLSAAQLTDGAGGGSLTLLCTAEETETSPSKSVGESLAASCDAVVRLNGAALSSSSATIMAPALDAWTMQPVSGTACFQGAAFQELAQLLQREIADDRGDRRAADLGAELGVELEPNSREDLSLRFRDAVNALLPRRSSSGGDAAVEAAADGEDDGAARRLVRLYLAASRNFVASLSLHEVPPLEFEAELWQRISTTPALLAWVTQLADMPPRRSRAFLSTHGGQRIVAGEADGGQRLLGEAMWYPLRSATYALAKKHLAEHGSIDQISLRWVLRQITI